MTRMDSLDYAFEQIFRDHAKNVLTNPKNSLNSPSSTLTNNNNNQKEKNMKPLNNDSRIEKLVATPAISVASVKAAQEKNAREEEELAVRTAQGYLSHIQNKIDEKVHALRDARAAEKKAKADLNTVINAEKQFLKDADMEAFKAATRNL
jgi:hypothetical protein